MNAPKHFLPLRLRAYLRHPHVRRIVVSAFWAATLFYFVFCSLILVTRWYLLPQVDRYKDDIAAVLSKTLDCNVSIGAVSPRWDSFWPRLTLKDVRLEKNGRAQQGDDRAITADTNVLSLPEVNASLYWRSVLGEPVFRRLTVSGAKLTVRRFSDTHYDIAGFDVHFNAKAAASDATSRALTAWFLKQGRLDVADATVRFIDLTETLPSETRFQNINFTFRHNLGSYEAGLQAVFADGTRNTIDARTRFTTPFTDSENWRKWKGEVYFAASRINFAQLLLPAARLSSIVQSGRGGTRTHARFEDGTLRELTSNVYLRDVTLQFEGAPEPLTFARVRGRIHEAFEGNRLTVEVNRLEMRRQKDETVPAIDMKAVVLLDSERKTTTEGTLTVSSADLGYLRRHLNNFSMPEALRNFLIERAPEGKLKNTRYAWQGSSLAPTSWTIVSGLEKIHIHASQGTEGRAMMPGVDNLSGTLELSDKGGSVTLASLNTSVTIPDIFSVPTMHLTSLSGRFDWTLPTKDTPLTVRFDGIEASNDDASATARGWWKATGGAGTLNLKGDIRRALATSVWKYMPRVVGDGTQRWLEAGLADGTASNGFYEVIGRLDRFPWVKNPAKIEGERERFVIEADVHNAALDYVPSYEKTREGTFVRGAEWPLLTGIDARLAFRGLGMTVTASGAETLGTRVGAIKAAIADLSAGHNVTLTVDGSAAGKLQPMLDYLGKSPIGGWLGGAFDGAKATGDALLKLKLAIPLLHARDTTVDGSVRLAGNSLTMMHPIPPVTDAAGTVHFNERGASARGVSVRAFGHGDSTLGITTLSDGAITFTASGSADVSDLTYFAPHPVFESVMQHVAGTAPFVANVTLQGGSFTASVQSNLSGVAVDLPRPLGKSADEKWPLSVQVSQKKCGASKSTLVHVAGARRFDVIFEIPDNTQHTLTGTVAVGTRAQLPDSGLAVAVKADTLTWNDWEKPLKDLLASAAKGSGEGENPLRSIDVSAGKLTVDGTTLEKASAHYTRSADNAQTLDLTSSQWAAKVTYEGRSGTDDRLTLTADKLHLTQAPIEAVKRFFSDDDKSDSKLSLAAIPDLVVHARDVAFDDKRFGDVLLSTHTVRNRTSDEVVIDRLTVASADAQMTGKGRWSGTKNASLEQTTTQVELDLKLDNTGKLLESLGIAGVIEGASGKGKAAVSYKGAPWSPDLSSLSGTTSLELRRGSIVQIDPGAGGALLSILSFQSLLKRLTLDFTDLIHDGLAFDSISGTSEIRNGVYSTDNTKISGTHGTVLISGDADLANRFLSNRVVFLPDLNAGNASLALTLVNPAVGIGTFLAQMLLRNPLSNMFKVEYSITGTFENPKIEKIESR